MYGYPNYGYNDSYGGGWFWIIIVVLIIFFIDALVSIFLIILLKFIAIPLYFLFYFNRKIIF